MSCCPIQGLPAPTYNNTDYHSDIYCALGLSTFDTDAQLTLLQLLRHTECSQKCQQVKGMPGLTLLRLPQVLGKLPFNALRLKSSSCNCTNNVYVTYDRALGTCGAYLEKLPQ